MTPRGWTAVVGSVLLGVSSAPPESRGEVGPSRSGPEFRRPGEPQGYEQYGRPMPAPLSEVASGPSVRQAVRTRGVLSCVDPTSGYLELTDKGDRLLVIAVDALRQEARSFVGLRVEVVGLPRALRERQGTCFFLGQTVPESICADPSLPALPDLAGHPFWPRMSLTIWSLLDLTPLTDRREDTEALPTLRELLDGADTPPRERVIVRGRFCGRGLCGDVSGAAPAADAWVLERDGAAVWVVGRSAKGRGWRLDPLSLGDTSRWLEVTGRLETRGRVRCLRADSVQLVRGPEPAF